jgi:hypothetical protein
MVIGKGKMDFFEHMLFFCLTTGGSGLKYVLVICSE